MWRVVNATGEDEAVGSEACLLDPFLHSHAGRRRDLKLHRALGLVLYHHCARCNLVAMADVSNLPEVPLEPELKPESGWHLSSLNLIDGLEVQEDSRDLPEELLAKLFAK